MANAARATRLITAGLLACGLWPAMTIGAPANTQQPATRPASVKVKIVLVGDSTVTDSAGWGRGFARLLTPDVQCVNMARPGRSSKSYRAEGSWTKALAEKPDYMLIQFGHNDVPGKGPKRETDPKTTFPENIARYVDQARSAGIKPILVTSLTQRHFGSDGKIHSALADYAEATRKVAAEKKVPLIDLHARSIELLNRLGPEASEEFDPILKPTATQPATTPPDRDRTHLTAKGAEVMGRIVADELKKVEPALGKHIK